VKIQAPDAFQGIRAENLSHFYSGVPVLKNISFTAEKGEVCAILGPNGAGKTTLLRLVTGFFLPAEGHIWHSGVEMTRHPLKAKRLIGYLPEQFPLYPYLTVYEFLSWCLGLRHFKGSRKQEIHRVLHQVDMKEREGMRISKLSRGMSQRVGLAQALLGEPPFLILDEPTSGLDPGQIRAMRDLIMHLKGSRTILLSTHILAEAAQVADRIIILSEGQIIASGKPKELAKAYLEGEIVYRISVKGPLQSIETKLKTLSKVQAYDLVDGSEDYLHFELRLEPNVSGEVMLKELTQQGIQPVEFYKKELKLEDIFMRALTQEKLL